MQGIEPLNFIPLYLVALEISKYLEGWIKSWWVLGLYTLIT